MQIDKNTTTVTIYRQSLKDFCKAMGIEFCEYMAVSVVIDTDYDSGERQVEIKTQLNVAQ